jgi:hypothetical protein
MTSTNLFAIKFGEKLSEDELKKLEKTVEVEVENKNSDSSITLEKHIVYDLLEEDAVKLKTEGFSTKKWDEETKTFNCHPEFVDCYNCLGTKMTSLCGMPMSGCDLCKKYGHGWGNLLKKYRYIKTYGYTQIYHPPDYETLHDELVVFTPPSYECIWCQDTGHLAKKVWLDQLIDDCCSDNGAHNMPNVMMNCWKCYEENHEKYYNEIQDKLKQYLKKFEAEITKLVELKNQDLKVPDLDPEDFNKYIASRTSLINKLNSILPEFGNFIPEFEKDVKTYFCCDDIYRSFWHLFERKYNDKMVALKTRIGKYYKQDLESVSKRLSQYLIEKSDDYTHKKIGEILAKQMNINSFKEVLQTKELYSTIQKLTAEQLKKVLECVEQDDISKPSKQLLQEVELTDSERQQFIIELEPLWKLYDMIIVKPEELKKEVNNIANLYYTYKKKWDSSEDLISKETTQFMKDKLKDMTDDCKTVNFDVYVTVQEKKIIRYKIYYRGVNGQHIIDNYDKFKI